MLQPGNFEWAARTVVRVLEEADGAGVGIYDDTVVVDPNVPDGQLWTFAACSDGWECTGRWVVHSFDARLGSFSVIGIPPA